MRMATSIAIFVMAYGAIWMTARRWRRRAERGLPQSRVARTMTAALRPLIGLPRKPKDGSSDDPT